VKKFIPIFIVVLILAGASYTLLFSSKQDKVQKEVAKLEAFDKSRSCSRMPQFIYRAGVKRPTIDLSQQHYKGLSFYVDGNRVMHKKEWERFDALGTYAIDSSGNIFLTPNPYISIKPTTFNLQKGIYKLDSVTGELSRWMSIDEVSSSSTNPYGLISIVYDCKDATLWVSAIDKTDYKGAKGRIYHINPKSKEILDKIDGFDALTIYILKVKTKRYLLAGSALDNGLYAYNLDSNNRKPFKLFDLPNPNLHIRKVKVIGKNSLKIDAIKFNYSLVAETNKKIRFEYIATYNPDSGEWSLVEKR